MIKYCFNLLILILFPVFAFCDNTAQVEKPKANTHISKANSFAKSKKYSEALEELSKALEIEPDNARIYKIRGNVYYAQRDYKKSLADFNKVIAMKPSAAAYRDRAIVQHSVGNKDQAKKDIGRSLSMDPKDSFAQKVKGKIAGGGEGKAKSPSKDSAKGKKGTWISNKKAGRA